MALILFAGIRPWRGFELYADPELDQGFGLSDTLDRRFGRLRALPKSGIEKIIEVYYKAAIVDGFAAAVDYQHVENPAYNALRGPVDIFSFRAHAEF